MSLARCVCLTPTLSGLLRVCLSPAHVQGRTASEDVCEPQAPEPSQFELISGTEHIRSRV